MMEKETKKKMKKERFEKVLIHFYNMNHCTSCPGVDHCNAWVGFDLMRVPGSKDSCMREFKNWLGIKQEDIEDEKRAP